MKIYTKTGDQGETGLLGGVRISKSDPVIDACGELDETNSFIGAARAEKLPADVDEVLRHVQNELFDLGSRVAASKGVSKKPPEFNAERILRIESWIDKFDQETPPLKAFILPGGCKSASLIHVARCVCRRAERTVIRLTESGSAKDLGDERIYLNRLGDLLFVLGRVANFRENHPETQWNVGST